MKNIYLVKKAEVTLPKKETIQFLLNYSRSLNRLSLNGLLNKSEFAKN
ncbi:hypothetical protein [Myroides injenensis]|nr:hypothetical protein [Myroides injenensis]